MLRPVDDRAPLLLVGASIPFLPSTTLAASAIGVSFLSFQSMLGNLVVLPVDLFGARPAGFSNSLLACVATGTQVLVSPAVGAVADRLGFGVLCVGMPVLPLLGIGVLQVSLSYGAPKPAAGPAAGNPRAER